MNMCNIYCSVALTSNSNMSNVIPYKPFIIWRLKFGLFLFALLFNKHKQIYEHAQHLLFLRLQKIPAVAYDTFLWRLKTKDQGPVSLLKQKNMLYKFLPSKNKQESSRRQYLWQGRLAGNFVLVSTIALCSSLTIIQDYTGFRWNCFVLSDYLWNSIKHVILFIWVWFVFGLFFPSEYL